MPGRRSLRQHAVLPVSLFHIAIKKVILYVFLLSCVSIRQWREIRMPLRVCPPAWPKLGHEGCVFVVACCSGIKDGGQEYKKEEAYTKKFGR